MERAVLAGLLGGRDDFTVEKLAGDGSARVYYRIFLPGGTLVAMAGPDRAENEAYLRIADHLTGAGVRVPAVHGSDLDAGLVLLEDLGDVNLLAALKSTSDPVSLYLPVLRLLVEMQVKGARGFALSTGFAAEPYGPGTMVGAEGYYFLKEFVSGVLKLTFDGPAVAGELEKMAGLAARADAGYFLHRDFQSRNIHRTADGFAVIDFQGARPGPLAYDAASLILDPYAALPKEARKSLTEAYYALLSGKGVDPGPVAESFPFIASFRLMQALGAFGKLGARLGKPGFLEHSGAALDRLAEAIDAGRFPALAGLIADAREKWRARGGA